MENTEGSRIEPLAGFQLLSGSIALSLCVFMLVLDYSIANVAVPYIAGDLAVSYVNGTWVITMFAVGNAITIPLSGWLADRYGPTRITLLSTALFTLFSLLCGLSFNIEMLVIMRFMQGLVAGPLIPLSQSLLVMSFPEGKKNFGFALWNMIVVLGPVLGPILGGWLVLNYSWPSIFYINLPFGLLAFFVIGSIYKKREKSAKKYPLDWVGMLLLAVGVSALQIMLDKGHQYGWWQSKTIQILAVTSVATLILFTLCQLTGDTPLLDLKLFKNRNFALGTVATSLSFMNVIGATALFSLWLQTSMNYTALAAGLAVSTSGIFPFFGLFLVAKMMKKLELRYIVILALLCYGASFFYVTTFNTAVTFFQVTLSRFYMGIGICFWLAPLSALTFEYISRNKFVMAQGIFQFLRTLMGGVGVALFVALWERRANFHHYRLVESIDRFNPTIQNALESLKSLEVGEGKVLGVINKMAWQQASCLALSDVFLLGMWMFISVIFALFFLKKGQH